MRDSKNRSEHLTDNIYENYTMGTYEGIKHPNTQNSHTLHVTIMYICMHTVCSVFSYKYFLQVVTSLKII